MSIFTYNTAYFIRKRFLMSQEQILKEATEAISQDNLDKVRKLLASTIEAPDANTVSAILKTAANYSRWVLVREIVMMPDLNKPNQNAIDYALERIFNAPIVTGKQEVF